MILGNLNAIYQGLPYQSDSLSEAPAYSIVRYLAPGEVALASSFSIGDEMSDYIKTQTGYSQYVQVIDNNVLEVGYGHQIQVDETIAGTLFDAGTIQMYIQSGGTDQLTYLSLDDADTLFQADIGLIEDYLRSTLTCSITPSQFDALCSWAFQIGLDQLQGLIIGQDVIGALNLGRMDVAVARLSAYVYVNGIIDANTLARRQDERDLMSTFTDPNVYSVFSPTGDSVQIGQFLVDPSVVAAITSACTTYVVDLKFAYVMVAQLSGFNPTCMNPLIGNMGLFMITPAASAYYGAIDLEFDPVANSLAGIQFIADAQTEFKAVVGRAPTGIELYSCMLLGQKEGPQYALIVANNPSGNAQDAVELLIPGYTAQFPTLFLTGTGVEYTNAQFMAYLGQVFTERYAAFS